MDAWSKDVQVANEMNIIGNPTPPYILSVGRLIKRKGFDWFIRNVLPKIVRSKCDIKYVIVGDGSYRPEIEKAIAESCMTEHVILLGKIDRLKLIKVLQNASLFVSPNVPVAGDKGGLELPILGQLFWYPGNRFTG